MFVVVYDGLLCLHNTLTALTGVAVLSRSESIRTGFLLSQGGEFAFVLLSLACQLKLLPEELNQILIITGRILNPIGQ